MAFVIGTAGHVDHGKSTLVHALTGIDPDRLAEEKAREMTIDLGFAWLTLPGGAQVGVVDVPGHRDFIENMLAGVGGIDLALFVVAADEGVMPQTREHLAIIDLLDIPGGIIVLTKTDLISDPDWLDLIMLDIAEVTENTVLEQAPVIPVSAHTGAGLADLLASLEQALDNRTARADRGKPRLPIDRVFTMSGFGTVVTGTLSGGTLKVGDEVEIAPSRRKARIRGIQSYRQGVDFASPGNRVAVNLSGVDVDEIQRGNLISYPGLFQPTTLIDVHIRHLSDAGRPLQHNAQVKFFSGSFETLAYTRLIGEREVHPGQTGWLQLRLEDPAALERGDRFIIRYPSPAITIGGGEILDPHPPHRWRRFKPEVIARFETLAAGTPSELVLQALESHTVLTLNSIATQTGFSLEDCQQALATLMEEGQAIKLSDQDWMARQTWESLTTRLNREIDDYHRANRLRPGLPREALRSRLGLEGRLFSAFLKMAVEQGLVMDEGETVRLPAYQIQLTEAEQFRVDDLLGRFAENRNAPPGYKEAIELAGEDILSLLIRQGSLVQVGGDVLFDQTGYTALVEEVSAYIQANGSITVAEARDLFNSSRKYVLGLLEHLDAIGVTRREGDLRVLRKQTR